MEEVGTLPDNINSINRPKHFMKLNLIALVIVLEMVLGGAGRLLVFGPLTLRYTIFAIALGILVLRTIYNGFAISKDIFFVPIFIFIYFYFIGLINGLINGYQVSDIIKSSQGYLYLFLYFPFASYIDDTKKSIKLFKIFNNASFVLSIISIIIFLAFKAVPSLYSTINPILKNFEYGHLSIRYGLPSVFFKTSPYMAIACVYEIYMFFNITNNKKLFPAIKIMVLIAGCMSTMTMGIWIALAVGLGIAIILSKGRQKFIVLISMILIGIVFFSVFSDFIISVITNRLNSNDSSYIIKSDQLDSMIRVWKDNLLFGKGFGVSILFVTEAGRREMIKFELFWIELLVFMGLTGFLSYIFMLAKGFLYGIKIIKLGSIEDSIHLKAILTGLIMICITSSVNPFLNNPIGIGYLILVLTSINIFYKKVTT